jgi:hypothetical protein
VSWKQRSSTIVELAQARGDLAVLDECKRRAPRADLAKESAGTESQVVAIADAMER